MELFTGDNKEQFEKWLTNQKMINATYSEVLNILELENYYFEDLPLKMQIGVILAYYDSLGYAIDVYYSGAQGDYGWELAIINKDDIAETLSDHDKYEKSRSEAHKQAFIKANQIINNL